jgi:hypothetical protein
VEPWGLFGETRIWSVVSSRKYFVSTSFQEVVMVRLFVRHPVSDFTQWKRAYNDFNSERAGMGVKAHAVFQAVDNANDVTVWHDFESLDSARAFLDSPRLKEVMEAAGVAGELAVWFTRSA